MESPKKGGVDLSWTKCSVSADQTRTVNQSDKKRRMRTDGNFIDSTFARDRLFRRPSKKSHLDSIDRTRSLKQIHDDRFWVSIPFYSPSCTFLKEEKMAKKRKIRLNPKRQLLTKLSGPPWTVASAQGSWRGPQTGDQHSNARAMRLMVNEPHIEHRSAGLSL